MRSRSRARHAFYAFFIGALLALELPSAGLAQPLSPVEPPPTPQTPATPAPVSAAPLLPPGFEMPPPLPVPPRALSLADVLRRANDSAVDARVAELQIRRAEAAERSALASLLPQLNGSLTYTRYDQAIERAGVGTIRAADALSAQVSVSETLSARAWNATRSTAASTRAATLSARESQRLARATVARTYFSVLTAKKNAELGRSQLDAALRQYGAVVARVNAGVALPIDRTRAELAVLEAARRVADGDASLGRSRDLLGQALALDDAVDAVEIAPPEAGDSVERYVSRALAQRTDVRVLEANREIAELAIDDAWLRFVPTLGLSWTLNWTSATSTFSPDSTSWTALATLSVPFYDGGARYAAMRDARASVEQTEERLAALRRSVRVEVRDAHRRLDTAGRALILAQRSVTVAEASAARADAAYRAGALTGIELEDARRALADSQLTVLLRALERHVAMIDLLSAAGLL